MILSFIFVIYKSKRGIQMGTKQFYEFSDERAKVEIPVGLLAKLISSGLLHGNDCKCLDSNARNVMWKSLLLGSIHD
jgi:hypothetical protein